MMEPPTCGGCQGHPNCRICAGLRRQREIRNRERLAELRRIKRSRT